MLLLHCVTYISLVLLVFAGKTRHGKDRANSHGHDVDPAERSLQDWRNLPAEVLKLACNASHILAGGSRLIMARRLYDFYHPPVPPVLHITLGIVLYLYNLLLKHVKELDATESSIAVQLLL